MATGRTIQGNTSGSITSVPFDIKCKIVSFHLINRSSSTIYLNMYLVTSSGSRSIIPFNTSQVSGSIYVPSIGQLPMIVEAGWYILLVSGGSVDYFINIENI